VQLTITDVTAPSTIVPVPPEIEQVWPGGLVFTVSA